MNTNKSKTCICGKTMVAAIFDFYCPDNNCPTNRKEPNPSLTEVTGLVKMVNEALTEHGFPRTVEEAQRAFDIETTDPATGRPPTSQIDYGGLELRVLAHFYPEFREELRLLHQQGADKNTIGELAHKYMAKMLSERKATRRFSFGTPYYAPDYTPLPPIDPAVRGTIRKMMEKAKALVSQGISANLYATWPAYGAPLYGKPDLDDRVLQSSDYTPEEGFKTAIGLHLHDEIVYETDIHTANAMKMFGIARPEDVTSDQRRAAKNSAFVELYGRRPIQELRFATEKTSSDTLLSLSRKEDRYLANQHEEVRTRHCDSHLYMKRMLEWPKTMRVVEGGWGTRDDNDENMERTDHTEKVVAVMTLNDVPLNDLGEVALYDYIGVHPFTFRCMVRMRHVNGHFGAKFDFVRSREAKNVLYHYKSDIEICFTEDRLRLSRGRRTARQPTAAERAYYRELVLLDEKAMYQDAKRRVQGLTPADMEQVFVSKSMVACKECEGSGNVKTGMVCPVCRGRGEVLYVRTENRRKGKC